MNLDLTEEQQLLRASVREFAEEVVRPARRRHRSDAASSRATSSRAAGELGLAGVAVPTEHGGSGMDTVSYAIVIEEISRVCANTGVILSVNNSLVCDPIEKFGNEDQKKRFLTPLARGEKLGCFALTEPDAGSDAGNQKTRAVREGDVYRISGQKVFITCGQAADVCLLFAMTNPEKKTARHLGLSRGRRHRPASTAPATRSSSASTPPGTVEIFLTDVLVPAADRLGRGRRGLQDRDVDPRRGPHRDRRPGRRHRAGGLRGGGLLLQGAARLRPPDRRLPGAALLSRRHGDRRRRRAAPDAQGRGGEGRGRRRPAAATRWRLRSPSSSRPRWRSA